MKTKTVLAKSPLPHYLIPETVVFSEDGTRLTGKVNFPSDDPTIRTRGGDHANTFHAECSMWNCAHIMADKIFNGQKKKLRVIFGNYNSRKEMGSDKDIEIQCIAMFFDEKKTRGIFACLFVLDGQILHERLMMFAVLD